MDKDYEVLMERMQRGGHRVVLNDQTRHLVIQQLLIDYVYKERCRQLDAIAVMFLVTISLSESVLDELRFTPRLMQWVIF